MLLLPLLLMQLLVFFMLFCSFVCSCCVSSAARYRVKRAPSFEQKRGELRNPPPKTRPEGKASPVEESLFGEVVPVALPSACSRL